MWCEADPRLGPGIAKSSEEAFQCRVRALGEGLRASD